jgi:hypothetical protein
MNFRLRVQLAEALGHTNRWYCSQFYSCRVDDAEVLLAYFIRSGGAADFARRFDEAMGKDNRWYCSQFYKANIRDPEILWNYYVTYCVSRGDEDSTESSELCIAG